MAIPALEKWDNGAARSRLEPIKKIAITLKNYWEGIIPWYTSGLINGILEGLNSLVQAAKTRSKGYRSVELFKLSVYMVAGTIESFPI